MIEKLNFVNLSNEFKYKFKNINFRISVISGKIGDITHMTQTLNSNIYINEYFKIYEVIIVP